MNMVLGAAAATAAAAFGPQLQTVERCSTYNDFVSRDGRDRRWRNFQAFSKIEGVFSSSVMEFWKQTFSHLKYEVLNIE